MVILVFLLLRNQGKLSQLNASMKVREARIHAPAHLQNLISLQSARGKESKTIDITSVDKVPDTIPEGKEVLPERKAVGNKQTPFFQ